MKFATTYLSVLGAIVSERRKARAFSPEKLAEVSGMSSRTLHFIEKGDRCSTDQLAMVSLGLSIPLAEFLAEIDRTCAKLASKNVTVIDIGNAKNLSGEDYAWLTKKSLETAIKSDEW